MQLMANFHQDNLGTTGKELKYFNKNWYRNTNAPSA